MRWCRCRLRSTAARRSSDEAARSALHRAAADLARDLGVQHLELRNRASDRAGMAAAGPVRHVPQVAAAGGRGEPARDSAQAARDGAQGHRARPRQRDRRARRSLLRAVCRQPAPAWHAAVSAALLRGAAQRVRQGLRGADRARSAPARRCPRCCRSISATRCCRTTPATTSARARSRPTTSSTGN